MKLVEIFLVAAKERKNLPLTKTSQLTILPIVSQENISSRGRKKEKSPTCTKDLSPSYRTLIHHWRKGRGQMSSSSVSGGLSCAQW